MGPGEEGEGGAAVPLVLWASCGQWRARGGRRVHTADEPKAATRLPLGSVRNSRS